MMMIQLHAMPPESIFIILIIVVEQWATRFITASLIPLGLTLFEPCLCDPTDHLLCIVCIIQQIICCMCDPTDHLLSVWSNRLSIVHVTQQIFCCLCNPRDHLNKNNFIFKLESIYILKMCVKCFFFAHLVQLLCGLESTTLKNFKQGTLWNLRVSTDDIIWDESSLPTLCLTALL